MNKQNELAGELKTQLVYSVVRYGTIVGCYSKQEDAAQIQKIWIEKGQICDLVVKPLL